MPNKKSESPEVKPLEEASKLSSRDKMLLKYTENLFMNSVDTLKNFGQTMITLDSGLFAVYFAILEFLGIKDIKSDQFQAIQNYVSLPPVLLIVSLISFVVSIVPLASNISFKDPSQIEQFRKHSIWIKYLTVIVGTIWLAAAMSITMYVYLKILRLL